ncbi:ABC transporter substrate-binding protein [Tsukamurella serpentis]
MSVDNASSGSPAPATGGVMRRLLTGVAVLLGLTLIASCGSFQGSGGTSGGNGDTLTISTSYAFDDLDPIKSAYWGVEFGYVELLMRPTKTGVPEPWVLSKLEPVDPTTWKLTLNDGVKTANGRAFDGAALAQVLTWSAEQKSRFKRSSNFGSAEVTGPLEVTLKTTRPSPTMANLLADETNVVVMDVDGYQKFRDENKPIDQLMNAGIYSGPYRVTRLDKQGAAMVPVEGYWRGKPALNKIDVRFVTDSTARLQSVQSGEVDIALYMPVSAARVTQGRTDSQFLQGDASGLVFGLISRVPSPVMQDVAVRRAVYRSVDYRQIAEGALQGHAGYAKSVFPPSYSYAVDTQVTDPADAGRELDRAGWAMGPAGVRVKNGQELVVRVLSSPLMPDGVAIAEAMQAQLKPVGIRVQVIQVDDHSAARKGADWDVSLSSSLLSFGGSPDQAMSELLTSTGSVNYAKINDPELDTLIADLGVTAGEAERRALLERIQRMLWDRGYYGVAANRLLTAVVSPKWKNYPVPVSNLWIDYQTAPSK